MLGFWNDKEGLSLNDFIAVYALVIWLIMTGVIVAMYFLGKLTPMGLELYGIVSDIPTAVVIGQFGVGALSGLGRGLSGAGKRATVPTVTPESPCEVDESIPKA